MIPVKSPKKLIKVSLPLDSINASTAAGRDPQELAGNLRD